MKRYVEGKTGLHEVPEIDAFCAEVDELCKRYNISMGVDYDFQIVFYYYSEKRKDFLLHGSDGREFEKSWRPAGWWKGVSDAK